MQIKIITISREFGSGGRTIGKMVAEHLKIACYDKELIEKVAVESGLDEKYIAEQGEYAPSDNMFAYSFIGRGINGISTEDYLWAKQREVILELAEKEPCVIVGRCADFVLKDRNDCLNVFVHAALDKRAERIVKLYGETTISPEKRLQEKDKKRRVNYKYYTDQKWGMAQNYHVCLNSGIIGIDQCADIIVNVAKTAK